MNKTNKDGSLNRRFKENREYLKRQRLHSLVGVATIAFLISAIGTISIWRARQAEKARLEPAEQTIDVVEEYKTGDKPMEFYERVVVPTPTPQQEVYGEKWTGVASWYSREGCIGCSANLLMANGKPLDDNALTVAFNRLPLGRQVRVTNAKSMMTVVATVTDTGGFERLGRIIDITPKVRDLINCGGLCDVIVEEILSE